MKNYDEEYMIYLLKCLGYSIEDKIDIKILSKEEFIEQIENKK